MKCEKPIRNHFSRLFIKKDQVYVMMTVYFFYFHLKQHCHDVIVVTKFVLGILGILFIVRVPSRALHANSKLRIITFPLFNINCKLICCKVQLPS